MDVRDNRHIAAPRAQTFDNILEIARVLHRWRSNPHNLATHLGQLDRLLDRCLRVHRVTRDHRLDADRIVPADTDVPDAHFAGLAALELKWIRAVIHRSCKCTAAANSRNVSREFYCCDFAGAAFGANLGPRRVPKRSCTSKKAM